jgi:hypothetical protein
MSNYARLSQKAKGFHALTGYTLEEFDALLPAFRNSFLIHMRTYTLEGKKRQKRSYGVYCNCPLPTMEDKLMFILMYLRKATTQDIFGEVFRMPQPVANKWIHVLHPCLRMALTVLEAIPARTAEELKLRFPAQQVYFQDGTERAIPRPKDQEVQRFYYSGKRKSHTVKNVVIINEQCKIVLLTLTCEGKKNDKKVSDEADFSLPSGSSLYQDTGFQGFALEGVTIVQPKKKPRGKELTQEEKDDNRQISSIRVRVEHAIGGVKRYRIVKDKIRNWKDDFRDQVMETCCGLHNFRLNFRPWHYDPISVKS